jgi:enterochelin esterase-like enzyme
MRSFSHFVKITGIGIVLAFGLQGCGGGNGSGNQYEVPVMAPVATNPAGETRVDNIKSVQADTTYNLSIYLPNGYDATKAYPIMYALDGDTNFTTIAAQMDKLQIKAIVVAVGRNDLRTRDYNLPGAYTYYKFLTLDLIPYIESRYKVAASKRTLEGHSFGGLFVGIALFLDRKGDSYFNNFVAQEGTYDIDTTTTTTIAQLEQQIFDASGGQMPVTVILSDSLQQYFMMSRGLNDKLKGRNYHGLTLKLTEYNQSHGGMFTDSLTDSLRVLFP